ncbi:caffeic acid 3-O-methyltransferase [Trifolium medium]|uniref:Caffeic acid 3-O-methyltransferase n=1 Tax=Trifolium medium TaxID=97028 RepID=A0A392RB26_9FABA|nr:caffeic acid 3-O-methyltransferase [Trifolium medium]
MLKSSRKWTRRGILCSITWSPSRIGRESSKKNSNLQMLRLRGIKKGKTRLLRKTQLFDKGRMLKADWDDMMIRVPEVKAEQELANQTQDNIEADWFKLRQQFIRRTSFKDWM